MQALAGEPLSAIESFYRSELPARGFKLMRQGPALPGGPLSLVFVRPRQSLVVQLRMDKGQRVRIVLVRLNRPCASTLACGTPLAVPIAEKASLVLPSGFTCACARDNPCMA